MVILISLAIVVIDQVSKYLVLKNLWRDESIPVIKSVFYITLVTNTGGAFGIFKEHSWFFITASLIAVIVILFLSLRYHKLPPVMKVSMGLILGGAVGNLIDRLVTKDHVVIDFLDFRIWPVFNIADTTITIGTCLLILNLLLSKKKEEAA